jgi:hypothetical protein
VLTSAVAAASRFATAWALNFTVMILHPNTLLP